MYTTTIFNVSILAC